jgi:hypothetical protein
MTGYKGKVKVKLSLYIITLAPRHEDVRRSRGIAPPLLNSALDGGEWLASRSRQLYHRYPLDMRQGGPHRGSEGCGKEKNIPEIKNLKCS